MNIVRCIFLVWLAAVLGVVAGCVAPKPALNPLAGWKLDYNHQPGIAIERDYENYIGSLPTVERKSSGVGGYFQDGSGKHAIQIQVAVKGTWWYHILIYDRQNRRIQVIKYSPGRYRS